jgi:hypothetical protein
MLSSSPIALPTTVTQARGELPVVWRGRTPADRGGGRVAPNSKPARVIAAIAACVAGVVFATTASTPAVAAGSNSVKVTARDYSYDVSGNPKAGWTQLTFANDGNEFHQLLVVALKPGVTGAQVREAVAAGNTESVIGDIGTGLAPGLPFLLGPRGEATAIAELDAGRYALVCFLAAPDGTSHAAHGMVSILRVSRRASDLTPPTRRVVDVTTSDFGITVPDGTLPARGWAGSRQPHRARVISSSSATRHQTRPSRPPARTSVSSSRRVRHRQDPRPP